MRLLKYILLFSLLLASGWCETWAQEVQEKDSVRQPSSRRMEEPKTSKELKEDSFGDYVKKVGVGIWNRLKDRFNLEDAGESLKKTGEQLLKSDRERKSSSKDSSGKRKESKPQKQPQKERAPNQPDNSPG